MEGEVKLGRGGAVGKKWCYQRRHGLGLTCLCIVVWQWLVDCYLCVTVTCWTFICDPGPCPAVQVPTLPHVSTIPYQRLRSVLGHQHSDHWRIHCLFLYFCMLLLEAYKRHFRQLFCPIFRQGFEENCMTSAHHGLEQIRHCSAALVSVLVCSSCRVWGPTIKNRGPF